MIVNPTSAEGWLQAQAMDSARARLVQALRRLDRHGRLAMYHPFTAGCEPIYVHAKIMVVDGASIRVGSANINKWSMGLDSECEVLVAGNDDAVRAAAAALRNGLLAEHFGTMPATVAAAITEHGLIGAVEALRCDGRSLRPYALPASARPPNGWPTTNCWTPKEPRRWSSRCPSAGTSDGNRHPRAQAHSEPGGQGGGECHA